VIQAELKEDDGILLLTPTAPLTKKDFERVAEKVDPYIESHGRLKGILIHADPFPGWRNLSAVTSHFRFVRDHHRQVSKVAAVGDNGFLEIMPELAQHFVSAEVKHFPADAYERAIDWIKSAE